ncbi:porin family protein [Chryseobacterium koreense]|mgnify:FL=1|uniref:porin family protein n=1 Tax=Chryseobacterium koreense TaxID=232216 RepID=UPI0026EB8FDF|nr:porin family protein [Chryseobacterium koreense]
MKKLFLVGALALFGAMNAQTFGLKAGMNIASVTKGDGSRVSLNAGALMNMPIAANFSIQPEVLYNGKGAKAKDMDEEGNVIKFTAALDYISVPVMFQYNALPNLYLEAGPEFSFLISAKAKADGKTVDRKDFTNSFDFGIGLGAGYFFTPQIGLTARYVAGMTDINKDNAGGDKTKNNVFQVGLAYKFVK